MRIRRASILLQLSFALGFATSTPAGLVIVRTHNDGIPPPPCAGIAASDGQGGIWSAGGCDDDGDGLIIFTVPKNVQESTDSFAECKTIELPAGCTECGEPIPSFSYVVYGRWQFDREHGYTLALAEPFDSPTFASISSNVRLLASIDVQGYLADNPFPTCGDISVTNGSAPQTTHAVFKDAASISSNTTTALNQLLDPAFVNALPNFSGTARVCDKERFRRLSDVPGLGSVGFIVLTCVLLISALWMLKRSRA